MDSEGRTPLFNACVEGNVDSAQVLLRECPAMVSVATNDGYLPIHAAAQKGHLQLFTLLMNMYPEGCTAVANNGRIALHFAAQGGNLEVVKLYLQLFPSSSSVRASDGRLPLHLAAFSGNADIVQLLLHQFPEGVRHATLDGGFLPLLVATEYGHLATARLLLDAYPAALAAVDLTGRGILELAIMKGHADLVRLFVLRNPPVVATLNPRHRNMLHVAALAGLDGGALREMLDCCDCQLLDRLLRQGDQEGFLPLHMAAHCGAAGNFDLLLQRCPQAAAARSTTGDRTCLHFAAQVGSSAITARLIALDAALVMSGGDGGLLPLHLAAFNGHADVVRLLLDADARCVTRVNTLNGWLPLHSFIHGHTFLPSTAPLHLPTLRILLRAHPPACAEQDSGGNSPFAMLRRHCKSLSGEIDSADRLAAAQEGLRLMLFCWPGCDPQLARDVNWAARRGALLVTARAVAWPEFMTGLRQYHLSSHTPCMVRSVSLLDAPSKGERQRGTSVHTNNLFGQVFFASTDVWRYILLFL